MLKRLLIYLTLAMMPFVASAQLYRFKHITTDDGLPTNYIFCMLRDQQGFMWFGTQTGLCRYDGYNITVLKNNASDKRSLSSSDIYSLYQHTDGKIYVGTRNAGLNIYNPMDKSIERIPLSGASEHKFSDPKITCIQRNNEDELWVGTNAGLDLFNNKTKKIKHIVFPGATIGPVSCVYKLNGKTLIGTVENGVWEIDAQLTLKKVQFNAGDFKLDEAKINTIYEIREYAGKLYCASQGEGVLVVDPENYEIEKVKKVTEEDLPLNYIQSLEIKENKIYANTKTGFLIINLLSDKIELLQKEDGKKSLNDNDITCFLIDPDDDLWLGTFAGGLNVFFSQMKKFPNLPKSIASQFRQTYSIYPGKNDKIWVGGEHFLKSFDPKTNEIVDHSKALGENYALSITGDESENLWLGTWGQGILKYNTVSRRSEEILPQKLGALNVLTEFLDKDGKLWAGCLNDGLIIYDTQNNTYESYASKDGVCDNVNTIFKDSENNFWMGSSGEGVRFIPKGDIKNKAAIQSFLFNDSVNSLASNTVYHIYEDRNKNMWFATEGGLSKYDRAGKKFTNYKEEDGLSNNFILSILPDSAGNLWMSTNKGISKFDPKVQNVNGSAFRNYDQKDGLLNSEYVQGAFCAKPNGELVFGSTNGINIFRPSKIKDNFHPPPVYLVSFKRSGKDVAMDSSIFYKKFIKLSWRENYFQIEVAALDYNDPSKNRYMFMLEGYDKDWSEPSNVRYVSYTELPGGDYVLKVKASNNDGIWNETPYYIHITVVPPFWKTIWFYILVSVIGLVGIILFTQYRTRAIKKENKILEHKVEERTKELAEKNRDITASIEYAKRIQEAILPSKDAIFSKFNKAFILYKPKDIVSGDFYWFGGKSKHSIFAVVDCTGHGVPGAFMSMIGHNLLNQIVIEKEVIDPGEILNQLHTGIQDALKQGRNEIKTNDGMDVSILSVNDETHVVKWAGAFRPLVIVRADGTLDKLSGNKYPVGGAQLDTERVFTTVTVDLKRGDTTYLFSDGYADQFGGDKGKKYMVKHFHDLLGSIQELTFAEQQKTLEKTFEQWRGNHEQVDDVLVVGIRF